jgi:hypothetical protein
MHRQRSKRIKWIFELRLRIGHDFESIFREQKMQITDVGTQLGETPSRP